MARCVFSSMFVSVTAYFSCRSSLRSSIASTFVATTYSNWTILSMFSWLASTRSFTATLSLFSSRA